MIKMNYSPEEVACNFCEYGTSNGNCKISICPFIAERIEAGVVGYREVVCGTGADDLRQRRDHHRDLVLRRLYRLALLLTVQDQQPRKICI